jgi:NAD(P)-dependent dehydrogenase (short-subunit alcohol dehydrogenase family)
MDIRFDGKTAVITGAGRGLGRQIALSFAEAGADIVIGDVIEENAASVCKEIEALGRKASYTVCDVRKVEDVEKLMSIPDKLDIMINVAGIVIVQPIDTAPQDGAKKVLDVNILGCSNTIRAALKRMIPQKEGKILLFSSIAARTHGVYEAHYAASKASVISMTMSAAHVAGPHNINVNAISPGIIHTAMWDYLLEEFSKKRGGQDPQEIWDEIIRTMIPLQRPQEPEDIADAAMFLCSDHAKNITGQTLSVCGGFYMGY